LGLLRNLWLISIGSTWR